MEVRRRVAANLLGVGELEAILAVEPLTVEGLFFRLLQAETQGMRGRLAERRRPPGGASPGSR